MVSRSTPDRSEASSQLLTPILTAAGSWGNAWSVETVAEKELQDFYDDSRALILSDQPQN
jgi:hypothetical protein